jgi:hypothetical protein
MVSMARASAPAAKAAICSLSPARTSAIHPNPPAPADLEPSNRRQQPISGRKSSSQRPKEFLCDGENGSGTGLSKTDPERSLASLLDQPRRHMTGAAQLSDSVAKSLTTVAEDSYGLIGTSPCHGPRRLQILPDCSGRAYPLLCRYTGLAKVSSPGMTTTAHSELAEASQARGPLCPVRSRNRVSQP